MKCRSFGVIPSQSWGRGGGWGEVRGGVCVSDGDLLVVGQVHLLGGPKGARLLLALRAQNEAGVTKIADHFPDIGL